MVVLVCGVWGRSTASVMTGTLVEGALFTVALSTGSHGVMFDNSDSDSDCEGEVPIRKDLHVQTMKYTI